MNGKTCQSIPSAIICRRSVRRVAYFDGALPDDLAQLLWLDPEALIHSGEMMRRTGLRRTVRVTWGSQQYVLKQYRPTYWHFVRQLPLRSWASSTFKATFKLINAGVPTPRPVACVENRWGTMRRDSFLMYPYVEGRTLRSYFSCEAKESRSIADNLWRQLGELWIQLAKHRASLADTNTGNFIVCPAGRIWVIDLDKACFHRSANTADRHQQRGWKQLLRSAAKC